MTQAFSITKAPLVQIQPLPKGADLAGIQYRDDIDGRPLAIDAWIDGFWRYVPTSRSGSLSDQFFDDNCEGCDYYFGRRSLNDSSVEYSVEYDGHETEFASARDVQIISPCPCYGNGLSSVEMPCIAGHDLDAYDSDTGEDEIAFRNMRFSLLLNPVNLRHFRGINHSPYLACTQRAKSTGETGPYRFTRAERILNVFEPYFEVCWGFDNERPHSLADAAEAIAVLPSNQDLLSIDGHQDNTALVERAPATGEYGGVLFPLLNDRECALILIRATAELRQSFLLLATAQSGRVLGDIAAVPATWQLVTLPDGEQRHLWVSDPLPDGHCWLFEPTSEEEGDVLTNGQILGQLQLSPNTPATTS